MSSEVSSFEEDINKFDKEASIPLVERMEEISDIVSPTTTVAPEETKDLDIRIEQDEFFFETTTASSTSPSTSTKSREADEYVNLSQLFFENLAKGKLNESSSFNVV